MPTVLLCHCDGTNGQTTFTDSSPSAHPLTRGGTTTVTTSQVKFGSGAADLTASSTGIKATSGLSDFDFQSGQFTLEAWAYASTTPAIAGIIAQYNNASGGGWLFGSVTNALVFWYYDGGAILRQYSSGAAFATGAWHFYTADRDAGGTLRLYIDGAVVGSTSAPTFQTAAVATNIGNTNRVTDHWPGYIDEVRITKGTALYAGAFTPPTAPFVNGGGGAATQAIAMVLA